MTRKYFRDEKRDDLILYLLGKGWDQSQIARKLRKTPQRINQLVKRLSSEGRYESARKA